MPEQASGTTKASRPRRFRTRLMKALGKVIARIPPQIGYPLANRLGDLGYRMAGRSRRAVISNLRQVMGPVPRPVLKKAVRGVFHNVTRNYYDLCRVSIMNDKQLHRLFDVDEAGWARMVGAHEEGRGVLLISAHFSAFDMMSRVLSIRDLPVTFLVAQVKPAWMSDFITDLRETRGVEPLWVSAEEEEGNTLNLSALKESVRVLRSGGVLGALADRNMEQRGVTIPFFGRDAVVAAGVAKMALRTRSVVVIGFCKRIEGKRFRATFDVPIEPVGSASDKDDIRALLIQIFAKFEAHIARSPDEWVLLQPVWEKL